MGTWSSSGSMCDPNGARGRRYYGLDVLRGLSIVLMVAYHWGYRPGAATACCPGWVLFNPLAGRACRCLFASVFVAISGASMHLFPQQRAPGAADCWPVRPGGEPAATLRGLMPSGGHPVRHPPFPGRAPRCSTPSCWPRCCEPVPLHPVAVPCCCSSCPAALTQPHL